MLKNKSYLIFIGTLVTLYVLFNALKPEPVDWSLSFSKKHKKPFGNFATFALLEDLFPGEKMEVSNEPPYTLFKKYDTGNNYMLVTSAANLGNEDAEALIAFVSRGNNAFIAASGFSGPLADELALKTKFAALQMMKESFDSLNFTDEAFNRKESYIFPADHLYSGIDEDALGDHDVLGYIRDTIANFIRIPRGQGNFYIHSNPKVFTNYNVLHVRNTHEYVSKAISYLPVQTTIWDEYYNTGTTQSTSELRYILDTPGFRWAWYTLIAFVFLYLLVESKRRQNIIPVLKPLSNTTLEFVTTVGRLYFQQRDHSNLAKKKAIYFLENIRKRYQIRTHVLDNEFVETLAGKSGIENTEVRILANALTAVLNAPSIQESQLLELNKMIENFNLKSKR